MKKNLMLLAAGAMLLMGGCSKSEIDEGSLNTTNAITFETSTNKATKAPAVTDANVQDNNFGVFAYYTKSDKWDAFTPGTEPNFMNNEEVSYSDTYGWIYDPVKYWPNTAGEMISFFGYMPFSSATNASLASDGKPVIEFTQTMDATTMEDLTVAEKLDQKKTTEAVSLPFKHVLSRLNFAARVDHKLVEADGSAVQTQVFIKGLRVLGTSYNNKVENPNDAVAANADSKFYNKASYSMSTGEWDYTAAEKQGDALEVTTLLNTTSNTVTNYNSNSVAVAQNGDATSLLKADEYLFLIPPTNNGVEVDGESNVVLQVDYDIVTIDPSITATSNNGYTLSSSTATLSMPEGSIKLGIAYNVVMTIDLNEVKLAADPTAWSTEEENAYTVVAGEAQSASEIATKIQTALDGSKDAVVTYNQAPTEALDIDFLDLTAESTKSVTINLLNQTGAVSITTHADYKGAITVNAPKATVTIDGGEYFNGTFYTAPGTLIIAKDATLEDLTIGAGNVSVLGTLKGTVTAGKELASSIISVMPSATYSATIDSDNESKITINDATTLAEGVYYSLDGGVWSNEFDKIPSSNGVTLKVIGIGNNTMTASMMGYIKQVSSFESIDFSEVNYESETFGSTSNKYWYGRTAIKYVSLPKNVTTIEEGLFYNSAIETVELNNVTTIKRDAFSKCASLANIDLSKVVTLNGYAIFSSCTSLKYADLSSWAPKNEDITSTLFNDCTALKEVILGSNVTKLNGGSIFAGCTSLEKINLNNVQSFEGSSLLFQNCKSLGNDVFDDYTANTFGQKMFIGCTGITECVIPESVTTIEHQAFYGSGLKKLTISANIETLLEASTFLACYDLAEITIDKDCKVTDWATNVFGLTAIKEIDFPAKTKSLGGGALAYTRFLNKIVMRNVDNVVAFGRDDSVFGLNPFGDATHISLKGYSSFTGSLAEGNKTLYVPEGLVDDYQNPLMADGSENYWKTVLIDQCGFEVKPLSKLPIE